MFRLYLPNSEVPSYLLKVSGVVHPDSVRFGGLILVWNYKGVNYIKPMTGKYAVKVSGGLSCNLDFNNVIVKPRLSLLNITRCIFRFANKRGI